MAAISEAGFESGNHLFDVETHQVRDLKVITVEKPDRGTIGTPPKHFGHATVVLGSEPYLNWDDPTLVINADEDSEKGVEADPGGKEIASC